MSDEEDNDNPYPAGLSSSSEDEDDQEDETTQAIARSAASSKSKKRKPTNASSGSSGGKKKKKRSSDETGSGFKPSSMIDDAAVLSGSDDDDEDDDEDENDENGNEYIKDDFVVDDEEVMKERGDDGLMDSDEDDSDEDDDADDSDEDGDGEGNRLKKKKRKRVNKMQDRLTQEDLDLIDESRGIRRRNDDAENLLEEQDQAERTRKATKIDELRNELFIDDTGVTSGKRKDTKKQKKKQARNAADAFDEEGLDDFIDDDVGESRGRYREDMDGMMMGETEGVSEAQINEANDIFGTEFLDFMADNEGDRDEDDDAFDDDRSSKRKFRERGVGVDLGIDSDDDDVHDLSDDDDDDDLFGGGEEDDDDGKTAEQRREALRLKKEKRRLAKEERRKKKAEQRKAKLRRAFEPVQLIENFCTDRDDEIRSTDAPERFFDWKTPFHGQDGEGRALSAEEQQEATWIAKRIPEIASEYASAETAEMNNMDVDDSSSQSKSQLIIVSIARALRFLHKDKFEPEFIRRYRADEVTSPAVRDNLYRIMDEDSEWERILTVKGKVEALLDTIAQQAENEEALGQDEEYVAKLKEDLKNAQDRLDESVRDEEKKKAEIAALDQGDEDEDDLFGDDDDEDDEKKQEKKKQKESLSSHLKTTQSLVKVCAEQVSSIEASLKTAEENSAITQPGQKDAQATNAQMCREKLWHQMDYRQYLNSLTEFRQIMDLYNYLKLINEGDDAIRNKGAANEREAKKRSKRFDRDYYRTCVSQGLRRICYKFALSPFRAGIKMEDNLNLPDGFNWEKLLPGDNPNSGDDNVGDPRQWNAPIVEYSDPTSFASDLVSSGELVLLASMNAGGEGGVSEDHPEVNDPLRGCRYVAAMELAYEPRIRRHLRDIYKKNAVLTTQPTSKGIDTIDYFHEFYGLHLLRNKKVKDHFYPDIQELERETYGFSTEERDEWDEKIKNMEKQSCLQYLNVLKAEKAGLVKVHIHVPLKDAFDDNWYTKDAKYFNDHDKQNLNPLLEELKKVYYPTDGDNDEWNNQREQILRLALKNFLLPSFEAEIRRELREAAFKTGIKDAGRNLFTMAMEGSYRPSHLLGDNRFLTPTGDLPIVGVCCTADAKSASYLAAVTERGEVSDHLAVPAGMQIDSPKMYDKVITFLMQSRPSAIVVGSHAGLSSRLVARKLGALATKATERWNNRFIQNQDEDDDEYQTRQEEFNKLFPNQDDDEDEDTEWKCNVEMVDDNVAQLFGRSVRGKKEFPDAAVNLKCAISIARQAKDPLAEIAYTWSVASDAGVFGTEMLFLNIHPLQQLLPKTLLLREYERIICRAVAEVGVDINLSCKYDHLHGLLSFIPGLGPRKAASLKHGLDRIGGVMASRRDLLGKRLVGPFVYNNAVAFLRIRDIDSLSNQLLHPLDDTRLHPHVYQRNRWATKIAIDALEMDNDDNMSSGKEEKEITAIRDIMEDSHNEVQRLFDATKAEWQRVHQSTFNVGAWDPRINVPNESWRDKVEELDLETFADMIEKDGKGKWLTHLTMIKWEFRLPFEDPRKPMEPLEKEKLFEMLTGESDQTLCPGREVTGKVARISDFGAHMKLEGDVPAFIPLRQLADGHVESAEDIVQIGQIVTAIVTEVKKDHMSVVLSLRQEDLQQAPSSWERPASLPAIDQKFDKNAALKIESDKSKEREERLAKMNAMLGTSQNNKSTAAMGRTGRVTNRACTHPAFRNKSHMEIEKELNEAGGTMVGEALIRPSKTNADALALHWLVREGVIKLIEVSEEDKDNDASIGNTLKIKGESYGSIDEMLARYIAPMNDRVEELIQHKKFLEGKSEDDVDNELKNLKQRNPNGVFYFLCWNEKYPGYASLRYILNTTPRYHHVGITPEGFNWCQTNYPDINYLLNAFKKEPRGKASNKPSSESASRSSRSSSERKSRSYGRGPSLPRQPPKWTAPDNSASYQTRPAPPSLPPPPQNAYPPPPPSNGWAQQRPQPPSLPPPPQNRYPPVPPGTYPSQ